MTDCEVTIIGMMTIQNFYVITYIYNVYRICKSKTYFTKIK
jgi:hypothetical protein